MSREILFRGKTEQGEWVYGYYCLSSNNNGFHPSIITGTERGCFIPEFVNPSTVGQYTGLTDKNGTRIFEHDIVEWRSGKQRAIVKYDDCGFLPMVVYWSDRRKPEYKIVGNIHEEVQE